MAYILFIFLLISFFFIILLNNKRLFSPSLLVDASFLMSTMVLITNWGFFGYEDISFDCVIIVSTSIVMMVLGEFLMKSIIRRRSSFGGMQLYDISNDGNSYVMSPFIVSKLFLFVTIILGIIITISRALIVYRLSLSLGNNQGFIAAFSYVRMYVNAGFEVDVGRMITYPAVFVKAASLYCMYVYCHNIVYCKKSSLLLVLPGVIYSIYTLTTTARTGLLELGCAFAVMLYAFISQKNRNNNKTGNKKIIRMTILVIITLAILFIVTGNIRSLTREENSASDLVNYAGSSLIVFSRWLKAYSHSPIIGYATAPGLINILNSLGLTDISLSFSDIFSAEDVLAFSKSNLKTWLKAPIQDFYLVGMFLSRFFLGLFYGYLSNRITTSDMCYKHPGRFIFACLLFYPLISACIADKYGNYLQLETLYMVILFYFFSFLRKSWNSLNSKKIVQ